MRSGICSLLATICLASVTVGQGMRLAPIETFDGKTWAGITIGVTQDRDLKRTPGVLRGAWRPEALQLRLAEGERGRVDALLDGRGGTAKVTAVLVDFQGAGPSPDSTTLAIGAKPVTFFANTRYEDWTVLVYPERGIVLFVLGSGAVARVQQALFLPPGRAIDVVSGLRQEEPTRVENYDPRFTDEELTVTFGDADVTLSGSNVDFSSRSSLERDIEDELLRRPRARFLDYDRREGRATLSAVVNVRWDQRRETLTYEVSLSVSGANALGQVGATGSASERWTRVASRPLIRRSDDLLDLIDDARRELERNFDAAVGRQRPPTKEEIRLAVWRQMIQRATDRL